MHSGFTRAALLAASLAAIVALPAVAATDADQIPEKPTFADDVAPIFYANCVGCHQPNDIAPMSLRTYDEARPWARSIGKAVRSGDMPPWDADPGYGPFKNDRSLTDIERETIVRWAKAGAPAGDLSRAPEPPPIREEEWKLGEPDFILTLDPFEVAASGPDMFAQRPHETGFDEDKWISAIEVLPGDKQVVHHVLVWEGNKSGDNPESMIGGWAAGADPKRMPEGTARLLKKGHPIISDMHYHPSGTAATDVTRIGIHFADESAVKKEIVNHWVIEVDFEIPAGSVDHEVAAEYTFPQDSVIHELTPHMHYRGKDFRFVADYPDGHSEELLKVSDYDFNWQTGYEFVEPLEIPAGTTIHAIGRFDNSKKNPDNPDYTKNVRFGNESFDEMMIGFVDYTVKDGISPQAPPSVIEKKIADLAAAHPGEVWRIDTPMPDGTVQPAGVHLPAVGDGGWYVEFAAIVGKASLTDIVWNGDDFTAKLTVPGQSPQEIAGKVDVAGGVIEIMGGMRGTLAE